MAVPAFKSDLFFTDGEGMRFTRTIYHNAANHGAAVTEAVGVGSAMSALSQCVFAGYAVTQTVVLSGALPSGNIDGEVQALFTFLNDDGKAMQISVPGFDPALKLAGTDRVNTSNQDVIDFVAAMTGGTVVDSRNIDVESLKSAKEHFTKKRKAS